MCHVRNAVRIELEIRTAFRSACMTSFEWRYASPDAISRIYIQAIRWTHNQMKWYDNARLYTHRCRLEGAKDTISHLFWLIIFSCLRLSFLSWVSLSSCVCYEYGCWRVCNFVCVCDTFWHGWYSTASCDLTLSVDHRLLYIFRRGWNFFSRLYCRRRDGLLRLLVKQ